MQSTALATYELTKQFPKSAERGAGARRGARLALPWRREKKYEYAVDRMTVEIRRGEIFGVLGANGSGKSTFIRMIATLLIPDKGTATVFGHDVVGDPLAVRRLINRVSVEASFFKRLSAMENLIHSARLYGVDLHGFRERALAILEMMDFPRQKMDSPVYQLSRGMQQKVAIARAFVTSPILLLLDEPTTGLDVKARRDVRAFIKTVRDRHDATILLTTHDMDEAEALCDRIAILANGKVIAAGTAAELKRQAAAGDTLPTMEETFLAITGKSMEELEAEHA
jgi:ABC-2 type transport system ATP-binding protein